MMMVRLLWEYLVMKCRIRIVNLFSVYGLYNILLGLIISAIILHFLRKETKMEDTAFDLHKEKISVCFFWIMFGVVFIAPPLPINGAPLIKLLCYVVFYSVFGITSMTDRQTGMFRAGYMMIGVFLTSCFTLVRIPAWIIDGKGQYLCMAVMAMLCNLLLGMFAYRFGDALLYLMTQFCILIWCAPNVWCAAMVVGLASAMVYFLVLYGRAFIEKKGNRKSRFPFTLCLFLGSLTTFFLFL